MSQTDPQFSIVRRGYEPGEVDQALRGLRDQLAQTQEAVRRLEQRATVQEAPPAEPPTFAHLGERIGQILALAEQEAGQLRDDARADSEGERKLAEQASIDVRTSADEYAEQRRRDAEVEAGRIVTDAKRAADQERDAAERDASARRQEAEAVYEQQRAKAAAAAADFETTLAERRQRTTLEFQEQQRITQSQLEALGLQIEERRVQGEREHETAQNQARQVLEEAEARAATMVKEAQATADRVRSESDRELVAATQRRDSINQQLVNVRQMLATLSGSAGAATGVPDVPTDVTDDVAEEADEAPDEAPKES